MDQEQFTEEALAIMLSWLNSAEAFTVENAPKLANEILTIGAIHAWLWFSIGLFFMCACLAGAYYASKQAYALNNKGNKDSSENVCILAFLLIVAAMANTPIVFVNLHILTRIYFAPRLYILQYLVNLTS